MDSQVSCGYEEEFVDAPPDYLTCIVCHLVLREPIQLIDCGHHYCSECFERVKKFSLNFKTELCCPIDRQVIDLSKVGKDKFVERLVADLHVKCSFKNDGCTWVGELRNLEAHRNKCLYNKQRKYECLCATKEAGARSSGVIKQILERLDKCEESLLEKEKHLKETQEKLAEKDDEIQLLRQQVGDGQEVQKEQRQQQQKIMHDLEELKKVMEQKDNNQGPSNKRTRQDLGIKSGEVKALVKCRDDINKLNTFIWRVDMTMLNASNTNTLHSPIFNCIINQHLCRLSIVPGANALQVYFNPSIDFHTSLCVGNKDRMTSKMSIELVKGQNDEIKIIKTLFASEVVYNMKLPLFLLCGINKDDVKKYTVSNTLTIKFIMI